MWQAKWTRKEITWGTPSGKGGNANQSPPSQYTIETLKNIINRNGSIEIIWFYDKITVRQAPKMTIITCYENQQRSSISI